MRNEDPTIRRRGDRKTEPLLRLEKLWESALDAVFPRRCPVCDQLLETSVILICPACEKRLRRVEGALCRRCGVMLADGTREYCAACAARERAFDGGAALFTYASVQESIFRFKYMGRQEYKTYYGQAMTERLGHVLRGWQADGLVPVPVHPSRMRARGYNQAQLLAEEIGKRMLLPVYADLVRRVRKTAPQKALNVEERQNNLKKAFKIYRNDVKLDTIIIVDDIFTTGSTIEELARLLRGAGARRIYFLVLAMANGR